MAVTTPDIIHRPPPPPAERGWGGGDGPGWRGSSRRASFAGIIVLVAATVMVFAAFTAAFVARRNAAEDWVSTPMPSILLANTAILLASSVVLDGSRRALRTGKRRQFNFWWSAATALGVAFLAGQALAWRQLHDAGFLLATAPSSSFFYLLTAAHAVHLVGGLGALAYVGIQAWRLRLGPARRTAIDVSAIFWHFLVAVWVYVVALLRIWG